MSWIVNLSEESLLSCPESFFALSSLELKKRISLITTVLPASSIYFPIKTNPCFYPLTLMAGLGLGADKSEVELALAAGFLPNRIIYNSIYMEHKTTDFLLNHNGYIVLDSLQQLQQLVDQYDPSILQQAQILLRLNFSKDGDMTTFGEELQSWLASQLIDKINVVGIHISSGTGEVDNSIFVQRVEYMISAAEAIEKRTKKPLKYFDVGGGVGLDHSMLEDHKLQDFLAILQKAINQNSSRHFWIELGRSLIGPSIALFSRIKQDAETSLKSIAAPGNLWLSGMHIPYLWRTKSPILEGNDVLNFSPPILKSTRSFKANNDLISVNDLIFFPNCGGYVQALCVGVAGYSSLPMIDVDGWEEVDNPFNFVHPVWTSTSLYSFQRYSKPTMTKQLDGDLNSAKEFMGQVFKYLNASDWILQGLHFNKVQKQEASSPTLFFFQQSSSAIVLYFGASFKGVCKILKAGCACL